MADIIKKFWPWAVVVVKWSPCLPSTLIVRVRIRLSLQFLFVKCCLKRTKLNDNETVDGPFKKRNYGQVKSEALSSKVILSLESYVKAVIASYVTWATRYDRISKILPRDVLYLAASIFGKYILLNKVLCTLGPALLYGFITLASSCSLQKCFS